MEEAMDPNPNERRLVQAAARHSAQPAWAAGHLDQPHNGLTVRTVRRVASLEHSSPRLVKTAERAGVDITYLGIAPLFDEPRAYAGPQTDWIIRPAEHSDGIIPAAQLDRLQRLVYAGLDFPRVYVAHEIPKDRLALPTGTNNPPVTLDQAAAAEAIGSVPPPAETSTLTARLGHSSEQLLTVLRAALPIAGAIAAVPFVIAAAPFLAAGAVAAGLDPIVFGVIPAGNPVVGEPAAWYILAQWVWPDAPSEPAAR
jgi:hypothetical protein